MKKNSQTVSHERILHIINSIEIIEKYTDGIDVLGFESNNLVQDAVLFHFSVIGEAIVHIDSNILEGFEYPWYKVRSFRNLIAHEYFNIKMIAVWMIIINDLPQLKKIVIDIKDSISI